jgi:hypothetical protein
LCVRWELSRIVILKKSGMTERLAPGTPACPLIRLWNWQGTTIFRASGFRYLSFVRSAAAAQLLRPMFDCQTEPTAAPNRQDFSCGQLPASHVSTRMERLSAPTALIERAPVYIGVTGIAERIPALRRGSDSSIASTFWAMIGKLYNGRDPADSEVWRLASSVRSTRDLLRVNSDWRE